jgi:V8-like Glu-specific endopeptidase
MPRLSRLIQNPLGRVLVFALLVVVSLGYVLAANHFLYTSVFAPSASISEDQVNANPSAVVQYWTAANMSSATSDDLSLNDTADLSQGSSAIVAGQAARQEGQPPRDANLAYPISTVGKIFFSDSSGRNYVCSGTAIASTNHNTVDTAGHCLYGHGSWMQNVLFCPLYENGKGPYDCWVARVLEVPTDWINAGFNDLHHDFGMAIVDPNSEGNLTDVVGGAGWAYNQTINQTFSAYGYPAGHPFDGQTRQSCENASGTFWSKFAGGTVVSIPCNMTGGSSGGPWFVQVDGNWYLNGHNDFTSSLKPNHMFSPYYDDTWYAMYTRAQNT